MSRTQRHQVIAIGLEAMDPGLMERWIREGHLPTFASLMRQGVWRRLRSTTGVIDHRRQLQFCRRQAGAHSRIRQALSH